MRRAVYLLPLLWVVACGQERPRPVAGSPTSTVSSAAPPDDLLRPENLGLLEDPDRDEWQQPERVMDALGITTGSRVADIGAGGGWFSTRLSRRVGNNGVVYAEDIQNEMLQSITRRVEAEGLKNVKTVLGTPTRSNLEPGLNAVLLVDTYGQLQNPVVLLRDAAAALAHDGRLGIVDFRKDASGGPGPALGARIDPEVVIKDAAAAGLKLVKQETFLRYQYLLVFAKS